MTVLPGAIGGPERLVETKQMPDKASRLPVQRLQAEKSQHRLSRGVLNDLRRTTATGLQRLGVRSEVTELILNHISGSRSGVAGVYQRHDWATEKRVALDAWAAHVSSMIKGRGAGDNVVTLARVG